MKKIIRALALIACLGLVLSSCSNLFNEAKGTASLRIVLRSPASRTILPDQVDLDAAISRYSVRLSRAGYGDITASSTSNSIQIDNLVPGDWTVDVAAFDAAGNQVASGSSSITAVVGSTVTSEAIQLAWNQASGTGSVEITFFFPLEESITKVEATLKGSFTKTIPVTIENDIEGKKVVIFDPAIPAGTPLLSLSFYSGDVVSGYILKSVWNETVWVFDKLPTRAWRTLAYTDFGKAPSAPINAILSSNGDGSAYLSWTPTSYVADDYVVERASDAAGPWTRIDNPAAPDPASQTFQDGEVAAPAAWHYRVAAENRFGRSAWAASSLAMTPSIAAIGESVSDPDGYAYTSLYWLDGESRSLTASPLGSEQFSTGIATSGKEVYVSGYTKYTAFGPIYRDYPVLWKNGVPMTLGIDSSVKDGRATAVIAAGSDIYVAGYSGDSYLAPTTLQPVLWKNGVSHYLDLSGYTYGQANAVYMGADGVYVAGSVYDGDTTSPAIWDAGGALTIFDLGGYVSGSVSGIAQCAGITYAIGSVVDGNGDTLGVYWRDDSAWSFTLYSPRLASALYASITGITVYDYNVYMSGNLWASSGYSSPVYWKNDGNPVRLDKGGNAIGVATGIQVAQGLLYVSGTLTPDSTSLPDPHPDACGVLWVDGEIQYLDGVAVDAIAPISRYELAPGLNASQQVKVDISDNTQVGFVDMPLIVSAAMPAMFMTDFSGDTYEWFLDGVSVLQGLGESMLVFPADSLQLGKRRITLFVQKGAIEYSGSVSFTVLHSTIYGMSP